MSQGPTSMSHSTTTLATTLTLFIQIGSATPVDSVDAIRDGGYQQMGCLGPCVYAVEHPRLLPSNLPKLSSHPAHFSPIICCRVALGCVGRGRVFENHADLSEDMLRKFGADSFLVYGRYDDAQSVRAASENEEDEGPATTRVCRFFATLSPDRICEVRLWDHIPAELKPRYLPYEAVGALLSEATVSPLLKAIGTSSSSTNGTILQVSKKELLECVPAMNGSACTTGGLTFWSRTGAWVESIGALHRIVTGESDKTLIPAFVLVVRLALGEHAIIQGADADCPSSVDTVFAPECPSLCAPLPDDLTATLSTSSFPGCTAGETAHLRTLLSGSLAALFNRCPAPHKVARVASWDRQLMPILPSFPNPFSDSYDPVVGTDVYGLLIPVGSYAILAHPTAPRRHEDPLYLAPATNTFIMAKKKHQLRVVERAGIFTCAAPLPPYMSMSAAQRSDRERKRSLARATPAAAEGLPTPPTPRAENPTHVDNSLAPPAAGRTAAGSKSEPTQAVSDRQGETNQRRRVHVYWDMDSLTPRNAHAVLKALQRILSLQDVYDSWNDEVHCDVFLDVANNSVSNPGHASSSFDSLAELLSVAEQLIRHVHTSVHPIISINSNHSGAVSSSESSSSKVGGEMLLAYERDAQLWGARGDRFTAVMLTNEVSVLAAAARIMSEGVHRVQHLALVAGSREPFVVSSSIHQLFRGAARMCRAASKKIIFLTGDMQHSNVALLDINQTPNVTKDGKLPHDRPGEPVPSKQKWVNDVSMHYRLLRTEVSVQQPAELTVAEVTLRQQPASGKQLKPYQEWLLPLMHCIWVLQQESRYIDVLLRDVFHRLRDTPSQPQTEQLYSAFHALVGRGWVVPGYGKSFRGQSFGGKSVCWVCFPSQIEDANATDEDNQRRPTSLWPLGVSPLHTPASAIATPHHMTLDEADPLLLSVLPSEALGAEERNGAALLNATANPAAVIDDGTFHAPPPFSATRHIEALKPLGSEITTEARHRRLKITVWSEVDHLLDMFPVETCNLREERQWLPPEIANARERGSVDELRVLLPLLTLQRQYNTISVDPEALVQRCVTLERMVLAMQDGGGNGATAAEFHSNSNAVVTTARQSHNYAELLYHRQLQLSHNAVSRSRQWGEDAARLAVDAVINRDRAVARLSNGRLCFVSDIVSPVPWCVKSWELEHAVVDADYAPPSLKPPPELSHVATRCTVPGMLLCRALRDELRVSFPFVAARLREVRRRWHDMCVQQHLLPTASLWDTSRSYLEGRRLIFTFPSATQKSTTLMVFWSDLTRVALTSLDAHLCTPGNPFMPEDEQLPKCQAPLLPFFAATVGDERLVCDRPLTFELRRASFRREVQFCPVELSFATQQESLQEQYLLVLHALQKLQRCSVVDAHVCDYLMLRLLDPDASRPITSAAVGPWSRIVEAQTLLATHRLVYVSGADVAFGSDYVFHVPHFQAIPKVSRGDRFMSADPIELQHDAAVLDTGVRAVVEGLMHLQRLWKRTMVPFDMLARVLHISNQLPAGDTPAFALERAMRARLTVKTAGAGASSAWITFTSDTLQEPPSKQQELPPLSSSLSTSIVSASAATPPPTYDASLPHSVPSAVSKPLNPNSKPFAIHPHSIQQPVAAYEEVPSTFEPQLPSSVQLLQQLTAPNPTDSAARGSSLDPQPEASDPVVSLSSLSKRRRVVHKKGEATTASRSVISQLFLTLERLEGRVPSEIDDASCGSSTRAGTPATAVAPPMESEAPRALPPNTPVATTPRETGKHFISALAWLFESALEDVAVVEKRTHTASSEQERRRRLCYSTLAAFFDTAAHIGPAEAANGTEADGDDVNTESPEGRHSPATVEIDATYHGVSDVFGAERDGIVVPSRERPRISQGQKRAIRQLHAKLTQAAMMGTPQDAEPWESVGYFFAKAEVIAGISPSSW